MRFASADAPQRPDYFDLGHGMSKQFDPTLEPEIVWNHIDGPLLWLRDGQLHWLTFLERIQCWFGFADAHSIERKRAPEFVARWEARRTKERTMTAPQESPDANLS